MQSIILLHGALGAASAMLPLRKALDPLAEVHVLDFSGHGESDWPEAGLRMETFEDDVLRFMDEQQIPSAHLFGYSMGGFVALRLALRAPERIKSITTLATKTDWSPESCAKESGMLNADTIAAKVPKFAAALDKTHPRNGWRTVVEHTQAMIGGMHRYQFTAEQYAQIALPVRMMVGDRDKMVSLDETIAAYRALPAAELCVLPGTPHPLEAADNALLARLIHDFASRQEG